MELESKAALRQVRLKCQALERRVEALDKALQAAIEADPALRRRTEVLRSIPGFGPATTATLLADMPELGTLPPRGRGPAQCRPCARDSGSSVGRRHVLAEPRSALYMAALTANRRNPPLAAFYKHLRDRGKQPKQARFAVMRKLVAPADALLRANRFWQPSAQVPA